MFTITRNEMITNLEELRKTICCYFGPTCDCKYGIKQGKRGGGEQTGCPEVRSAISLLKALSDKEYESLMSKAGGISIERLTESLQGKTPNQATRE